MLTLPIPGPAKLARASAGCSRHGGTEWCSLGSLAPGGRAVVHFTLTPTRADPIRYLVHVEPSQLGDPVRDNQAAANTVIVRP
jgi:hypothetical protein